jgi:tetratricopeptide (TPR) repeat protein
VKRTCWRASCYSRLTAQRRFRSELTMAEKTRLLAMVLAASLLVTTTGHADDRGDSSRAEARAHFRNGARLIRLGSYSAAVAEFSEAYRLYPNERIHYDLAQAYRLARQSVQAVAHYRLYLAAVHEGELAEDARQQLKALGAALDEAPGGQVLQASIDVQPLRPQPEVAREPSPALESKPDPVLPQPEPPTPPTVLPRPVVTLEPSLARVRHPRPIYKKWWVWTVGGMALVGIGVGLGVGLTYHGPTPTIGMVTF